MIPHARNLHVALVFAISCLSLHASEPIGQVAAAWKNQYGEIAFGEQYHYRCEITQRPGEPALLAKQSLAPESREFEIEVFRLGRSHRIEIRSDDPATHWCEIFDGEAKFVSQNMPDDWTVSTARELQQRPLGELVLLADPLCDILGLDVSAAAPAWALGFSVSHEPFSVPAALSNGEYRVALHNDQVVQLVNNDGDRLLLSVPHGYALAGRNWKIQTEATLQYSLTNRQWRQLADGEWIPGASEVRCTIGPDNALLYSVEYAFTPLRKTTVSDYTVRIDRPGSDITYYGGDDDFRVRRVNEGEIIDLTGVAHGTTSIRWDTRQWPPFTFLERWNVLPLLVIAVFVFGHSLPVSRYLAGLPAHTLLRIVLLLSAVFVVLVHASMVFYEGGTVDDHELTRYSWTHNFLSDLGRDYRTGDGENAPANILFRFGMIIAGVGTVLHMWVLPALFRSPLARRSALLASVFGMLAAWFFVRVSWAPIDRNYEAHRWFAQVGFAAFGLAVLSYAVAQFAQQGYPKRYGVLLLLLGALICGYLLLRNFDDGRVILGSRWLSRQATSQKLVFYSIVACMLFQIQGSLKWLKQEEQTPTR